LCWLIPLSRSDKAGYVNRVGEFEYDYYSALARNFKRSFEPETAQAALQAAWTTGVIRLALGTNKKNESKYSSTDIDNGDIVVTIYQFSNVSDTGSDLLGKLGDASGLSLKAALDVKKYAEEQTETIAAIQADTQLPTDVTVDVDLVVFSAFFDKAGYTDRVGEFVLDYLKAIHRNLERAFKEDETARSALHSHWTTGVIRLTLGTNKKNEYKYTETQVDNGDLVVTIYQFSNVSDTAADVVSKLGDPETGLSLKSALNVKKYEEAKNEHLAALKETVGLAADVTVDADLKTLDATVNKLGYENRVGEFIFDDILKALLNNLKRSCADEMAKEAIGEAWATGVIRFAEDKKCKSYHSCDFVDGDLVISYKSENLISNISDIGNDIEGKL